MYLRKFEQKDAVYMLEWMHDKEVTKDLAADFEKKQLKDAEEFIISSRQELKNLHLAIVSDTDEYMGTVR